MGGEESVITNNAFLQLLKQASHPADVHIPYPVKSNRYLGGQLRHQECYTETEKNLLQLVADRYRSVCEDDGAKNFFALQEIRKWHDLWQCDKPTSNFIPNSFTVVSQEAKDPNSFPLWSFSYNLAKQVANKQSERINGQNDKLINDPVMLVFEELKQWLLKNLSAKECKLDVIDDIAKRQNYIRNVMHIIPDFGSDRIYLHELSGKLEQAKKIVIDTITNKQLPHLLSDVIVKAKDLENTIATYLHFLLINEEVSDNFSDEFIKGTASNCNASPLCKIFNAVKQHGAAHSANSLVSINPFYNLEKIHDTQASTKYKLELNREVLKKVNFASFVASKDITTYLESVTLLAFLMTMADPLKQFGKLQATIGSYGFAVRYMAEIQEFAKNYLQLIDEIKNKLSEVITCSDQGLKKIFSNPDQQKQFKAFTNNRRALDTNFATHSMIEVQLIDYCNKAKESMLRYQEEIQKLVSGLQDPQIISEIDETTQHLVDEINYINSFLSAHFQNKELTIHKSTDLAIEDNLPISKPQQNNEDVCNTSNAQLFDYGIWDQNPKIDPFSKKPIYIYKLYKNNVEVGSAEFFGQPYLCKSADEKQHNLIKLTGVLSEVKINPEMDITEVCDVLPPSMFDKIFYTAITSGVQGFLRGSTNVLAASLRANKYHPHAAYALSQLSFYSGIFIMNFTKYCLQLSLEDSVSQIMQTLLKATINTGELLLINCGCDLITSLSTYLGDYLKQNTWHKLGNCIKKTSGLLHLGLFAFGSQDTTEALTSLTVGSGTAIATEYMGNKLLKL